MSALDPLEGTSTLTPNSGWGSIVVAVSQSILLRIKLSNRTHVSAMQMEVMRHQGVGTWLGLSQPVAVAVGTVACSLSLVAARQIIQMRRQMADDASRLRLQPPGCFRHLIQLYFETFKYILMSLCTKLSNGAKIMSAASSAISTCTHTRTHSCRCVHY